MDKDFDKEQILDKMRALKTKRDMEILNTQLNKTNIDTDYQKKMPEDKVLDVKYLGKIEWEEEIDGEKIKTEKDIFLVIEQKQNEEGNLIQVERYCTEDGEVLGGNNRSDQYDFLLLSDKYKNRVELLKDLRDLDKEGILDLNEMEQERLETIAKTLGVEIKDIESIDEIDPDQEVESKDEMEHEEITEKEVKGLNIKEEVSADTNLKGQTLSKKLGLADKGITDVAKIARVTTSSLNKVSEQKNNNIDAFVAIKNNGEAVILGEDILRADSSMGTNPTNEQTTINNDGTVNKETVTSSYFIVNGNGREYLQIGNDELSGKEIKYTQRSTTSNENVAIELNTQRTMPQNSYVRQYLKDKGAGIDEVNNVIARDKAHGECNEKDVTVVDNDKNNDSHEAHVTAIEDAYLDHYVRQILDTPVDEEVGNSVTIANFKGRDAVKGIILKEMKENEYANIEEVVEKATQKIIDGIDKEEIEQERDFGRNIS